MGHISDAVSERELVGRDGRASPHSRHPRLGRSRWKVYKRTNRVDIAVEQCDMPGVFS